MSTDPMPLIVVVCLAASVVYVFIHVLLSVGLLRHRETALRSSREDDVSVIVAARNEAENIGRTLTALIGQTLLPREIIVVDDRSTDDTATIVESFSSRYPTVRLVRVTELPEGYAPKKHALARGIALAGGSVLCFTDADSIPPLGWVEEMVNAFDTGTGVVVGTYVPKTPSGDALPLSSHLLQGFIRYEKLRTTAFAAGSLELGFPWMASGASLAYRKEVYDQVGGFDDHRTALSGDDDLFLQTVIRTTTWKVVSVLNRSAAVETRVPTTLLAFIGQRKRHFSAGRKYSPSAQVLLALYHASNLLAIASLPLFLVVDAPALLGAYAIKVSADLLLLASTERHLKRSKDWAWFVLWEFFYVLYVSVIGPLGVFGRPRWKEQGPG